MTLRRDTEGEAKFYAACVFSTAFVPHVRWDRWAGYGGCDAPGPASADDDEIHQPSGSWNGKKIYLSPARHADTGSRGECRNGSENVIGYYAARATGVGYGGTSDVQNLVNKGYKVRIGRGTVSTAIERSNNWNADLHIPLHSNATTGGCGTTSENEGGTWTIYESNAGERLSNKIRRDLGPSSPGDNERTCTSSQCTVFDCLGELCDTQAVASYVEAEFHTWNRGIDWLREQQTWSYRIVQAIELHLDYP